jgi:superfamily II DNA/RNA helicase
MATTVEELEASITQAVAPGFRGRLLDQGEARSMIWREGQLPDGSPRFPTTLSYDLYSYAYSILGMGLRLRDGGGNQDVARAAFEHAAMSLESILINGEPGSDARSFHYVIAGASYHLARFSARAYSVLVHGRRDESFSPIERCLYHLIMRDLTALQNEILTFRTNGAGRDASIAAEMERRWTDLDEDAPLPDDDGESYVADALGMALIDTFLAGMGLFLFAIERGEQVFVEQARERLRAGLEVCAEVNLLPQWWTYRLTIYIIDDLWSSSFHQRLPLLPNAPHGHEWELLRRRFISLLFRRPRAEIDLWPSQLDAASIAVNEDEDIVASLPTSAGKTRIAELCILRCLASGRRIVFVTPLRALSAQTETTLQRTFVPLGKSISTLYGSIGTSAFEEDALGSRSIVVATPEKLDFALRSAPTLLDDVGLIVLDEGHMIGLGEREIRYEVQIQRLLKRGDADSRRIVCLSAILPEGPQLDDFVAWLRQDGEGSLIKSEWRPTKLRFGEVTWGNARARLEIRVGDERPFVPTFFPARRATRGSRQTLFPNNHRELVLATSWRLAQDGQTVLIYCPERRSVEPYAREIIRIHKQGLLTSLIGDAEEKLSTALAIGVEWLGENHPILACLRLGVAVHHGALPTPFRKEIERLLRDNVLRVTISSPTLAQGLNLSATAIVLHGIIRNRVPIGASEFRNVVGRAGRAFVDVEGLVLFPFFELDHERRLQWETLIEEDGRLNMESGVLRLVVTLLQRMQQETGMNLEHLSEYVLNNVAAWNFPNLPSEEPEVSMAQERQWHQHLATLDTAILSLVGEQDITEEQVPAKLDEILSSSLWERRLRHRTEERQRVYKSLLHGRARFLWANSTPVQRRSYFLAGIGYETGRSLDGIAAVANDLLIQANGAILQRDSNLAVTALTSLAELLFGISPFIPDPLPENWRNILKAWLLGQPLAEFAHNDPDVLRFIEAGLIYRLPWGMEALRVRAEASGDQVPPGLPFDAFETGIAVPAVEVGTLNRSAAVLMQAGFTSRMAAIKAVAETGATFEGNQGLRDWMNSDNVVVQTQSGDWPTPETAELWKAFIASFVPPDRAVWNDWTWSPHVTWEQGKTPLATSPVRVVTSPDGAFDWVVSPDHEMLGRLTDRLHVDRKGLVKATVAPDLSHLNLTYIGPNDLTPAQAAA